MEQVSAPFQILEFGTVNKVVSTFLKSGTGSKSLLLGPKWKERGHSLVWLEYWPVTPKVAGSSPVVLEIETLGSQFILVFELSINTVKHQQK